ncbi:MAG: protoporphyrinogen oxidase [Chlamydiales bacterium]|nr:protoporphyrinogen oxidase [Chlamydiales bacterium]
MRTIILGGGISGLSAAWFLHKKDPRREILLLEKKERLGGWIEGSIEGEFCFEKGPRTLSYSRSTHLLRLIHELGLEDQIIYSSPSAKHRFLWKGGKLRSLSSFWPTLLAGACREFFAPKKNSEEDESIYAFASRRFGPRIADIFFDPLTLGIYAGDIHKLSIRSCFPSLCRWEMQEGSIMRGMLKTKRGSSKLFTLQGGLETLILEMQKQLPIEIITNCEVERLSRGEIITSQGVFQADQVISALSAQEISRVTKMTFDVPCRSLWVVHLGFHSNQVLRRKGFGYLVPTQEKERLLGMVWDSEIFGSASQTRLTAMIREESPSPLEDALEALERHLSIQLKPDYVSCHFASGAIPQFEVGYEEKLACFEKEAAEKFPYLLLAGNYWKGASLDACVARSLDCIAEEAHRQPSGKGSEDEQ